MQAIKLTVCIIAILFSSLANAGIKEEIAKTIVRVHSGSKYSTGFFWKNGYTIITTLHSVDDPNSIEIYIPAISLWKKATVKSVYKRADLLCLNISGYESEDYIVDKYFGRPSIDTRSFTIGYNSGNVKYQDRDFAVGLLQGNTLGDLLPSAAKTEIQSLGFPSLTTEIIYLKGSLLHGFSGSPIVDYQGKLIGVADGGLENGAAAISWCIYAGHISNVENSTESLPYMNQSRINSLFAAEDYTEKDERFEEEYFELSNFKFRKIKTRSFAQIDFTGKYSSMDALGLNQLLLNFSNLDYRSFKYDVYLEENTGATIVLPADEELYEEDDLLVGGDERIKVYVTLENTNNIQGASQDFEHAIMPNYLSFWVPDVVWSYPMPYPGPNNSFVRRRAYMQRDTRYYLFEALAAKGNYFLGVAAKRDNIYINDYNLYKQWAKYAIGVQLSSFTN